MGVKKNRGTIAASHLHSYTDWTSAHGVPQIGRSRQYYCMGFWAIITIIALGLLIWQTTLLVIQYFSYEVAVQIELKFEQRPFPAVTICNLNPYRKSIIYENQRVIRLMNAYEYSMQKVACGADPSCKMTINSTMEQYRELYNFVNIKDTAALQSRAIRIMALELGTTDVSNAVVDVNDFLQGCSFNTEDCDPTDWTTFIDPQMGRCFVFNLQSQHMAKRAGPIYGLRVVLKTNISDFISTTDIGGMRVLVHDQGEYPFPDIFGYNVQTGAATSVGVTYREMSRLGEPYGACTNDKPDGYLFDRNYSTEGCQRTRYQTQMVASCQCYDPHYPPLKNSNDTKPCNVEENFDCWLQESNVTTSDNSCTQPCNEGVYDVTVSTATWPSGSVKSVGKCEEGMYGNKTCIEVFRDNGALVEVYYEKLNYETMEESASYTLVSLLSDFGGQIGLWLGMSVVSIIELFVLGFQLCVTAASPKAGNSVSF